MNVYEDIKAKLDAQPLVVFINEHTAIPGDVKTLYQYTHWDALFHGIVDGGREKDKEVCIRATNCRYLNDPKEVLLGKQLADEILKKAVDDASLKSSIKMEEYFVSSFSEKKDYLPMWSMYGKGGTGLSVGFDVDLLKKNKPTAFGRCLYCSEFFLKGFREANENNTVTSPTASQMEELSEQDSEKIVNHSYYLLLTSLQKVLTLSKTPEYTYEGEVRICVKSAKDVKYRNTGKLIVPYIDMFFPKEIIKEIIVGPTNEGERAIESLKDWLNSCSFGHVNVIPSKVPYRQ